MRFCKLFFVLLIVSLITTSGQCFVSDSKRVILLGLDGLSTDGLQIARTPNLDRLIHEGALSLHARGVFPTVSSPNWASLIMGVGPEQHGITANGWTLKARTIEPILKDDEGFFPTVFNIINKHNPIAKTALFYDWGDLANLFNQKPIGKLEYSNHFEKTFPKALSFLKSENPVFTFIYVGHIDEVGHAEGHGTQSYYHAIEQVDKEIGNLLSMLNESGLYKSTSIIVTSDHGGVGFGHGGESMAELEIPWIISGPGIIKNRLIDQPVNSYDTASTILYLLGLTQPSEWIGKPVLGAFEKNDESLHNDKTYLEKPASSIKSGIYLESQSLVLSTHNKKAEIRFTIDGSIPDKNSSIYSGSIDLSRSMKISACSFYKDTQSEPTIIDFLRVTGIKEITLKTKASEKYPAKGALSLVDRKTGDSGFKNPAWMGFESDDLDALLDFGQVKTFNNVILSCLDNEGSWIFLPEKIEYSISLDGEEFQRIGELKKGEILNPDKLAQVHIKKGFKNVSARYLRIKAKNIGLCPVGHVGEGGKAWLFVDEIFIE